MSPIAIIQARTNSTRLPGKVLMEIAGKPIIHHVIDACGDFETVVAIPYNDDALRECIGDRAEIVEGPELDVASRFEKVIKQKMPPRFIRICADSPVLQPGDIKKVSIGFREFDVVRTVGCPGRNAENVCTLSFLYNLPLFNTDEREHVTSFYYRGRHAVMDLPIEGKPCVVDTQEDFDRVKKMMECAPS